MNSLDIVFNPSKYRWVVDLYNLYRDRANSLTILIQQEPEEFNHESYLKMREWDAERTRLRNKMMELKTNYGTILDL